MVIRDEQAGMSSLSASLSSEPEKGSTPSQASIPATRASRGGVDGDASKVLEELERVRNGIQVLESVCVRVRESARSCSCSLVRYRNTATPYQPPIKLERCHAGAMGGRQPWLRQWRQARSIQPLLHLRSPAQQHRSRPSTHLRSLLSTPSPWSSSTLLQSRNKRRNRRPVPRRCRPVGSVLPSSDVRAQVVGCVGAKTRCVLPPNIRHGPEGQFLFTFDSIYMIKSTYV